MRSVGLVLVLAATTLATAAGRNQSPDVTRVEGIIAEIDPVTQQVLVEIASGDEILALTVQVTPSTSITMGGEAISFDELSEGMTVVVCGQMDGDVLMAHKMNVKYGGK